MTYWINAVSRDHVQRGVAGGFTQANHGKPYMLRRMKKADWIIFYSPKTTFEGNEPLQAFTAIGQITDNEPYQDETPSNFQPWRRKVAFKNGLESPIRPLIEELDFIEDKIHWGYKFRFGVIEISEKDFLVISTAMGVSI